MLHVLTKSLSTAATRRYYYPTNFLTSAAKYRSLEPTDYNTAMYRAVLDEALAHLEHWLLEESDQHPQLLADFVHPYWQSIRLKMRRELKMPLREDFLRSRLLQENIGWGGGPLQGWQRSLLSKGDPTIASWSATREAFLESRIGFPYLATERLGTSKVHLTPGSVQHGYYLRRIDELYSGSKKRFIEFGGGYGGLARMTRLAFPKCTYTIIDTPESLAIQYLYYKLNFPHLKLCVTDPGSPVREGMLNLVPFWRLPDLLLKADVFLSTFALSESTPQMRQAVAKRRFFGVDLIYMQAGRDQRFNSHSDLARLVAKHYKKPHITDSFPGCYELVARS
jgi:hypothetical protein